MHRKMLIKHCFAQDKLEHQPNYELQSFQKYSLSKYILMHFVPMLGFEYANNNGVAQTTK